MPQGCYTPQFTGAGHGGEQMAPSANPLAPKRGRGCRQMAAALLYSRTFMRQMHSCAGHMPGGFETPPEGLLGNPQNDVFYHFIVKLLSSFNLGGRSRSSTRSAAPLLLVSTHPAVAAQLVAVVEAFLLCKREAFPPLVEVAQPRVDLVVVYSA